MRIIFLHSIASAEGWAHPPGQPVEFHDDELAKKFIASGIAVADPEMTPDSEAAAPETMARKTKKR